ncbi:28S ribosomal protein S23, mitochondrial-like isoform X2 [Acanthaster planci]|nr:28S ribosomal protein S23, mitochondrial-like isoform X2 [Acanthaster planci]XP_022102233.1 28S ribosomal protein S23, mitochondrial-like isoform X2 [Acanthaster planci]
MRAGVMKEADKPIWYDIMAAFPPRDAPTHHRDYKKDFLPEILYEEDAVRAQFYKVYGKQTAIDLTQHEQVKMSPCYRFISKYQELKKEGTRQPEELFEAAVAALAQEGLVLRKQSEKRPQKTKKDEEKPDSKQVTKGLALLLQQAMENEKKQTENPSFTTDRTVPEDETNT